MTATLDDLYLEWLYTQVASVNPIPPRSYWSLLRQLYTKEFVWFVPNDDNRVEDGRSLRHEFLDSNKAIIDQHWLQLPCSFLEMLIALARRLSFEMDGPVRNWFWHLLGNLHLEECTDAKYNPRMQSAIDEILDAVVWRTYNWDGQGGLFPLKYPGRDQRQVEIWYQMAAYFLENE
jgi:hypothetical protein